MKGHIPESFINGLIERTSIIEVIEEVVPLKKRGKSYTACCPFHNEKTPSFNVSEQKQLYHCFGCNAGGNVISFLMSYHNQSFVATCEQLAKRLGLELPIGEKNQQKRRKNTSLKELLQQTSQQYQSELQKTPNVLDYLQGRGLTHDIISQFQLGFAPKAWHWLEKSFPSQKKGLIETGMLVQKDDGNCYDRYRGRLMFPIHNEQGEIIGFGGRVIEQGENPKYLNSPETSLFHKSYELYGLYQAKQQALEHFIVVEGYMDVIALSQAGVQGSVATLGTASTPHHLKKLTRLSPHIIFCFDGDTAGMNAALRAMEQALSVLKDEHHYQFLCLPQEHDPDSYVREFGKDAFHKQLSESPDIVSFLLSHLREQVNLNQTAGRTKLITLAAPYFQAMAAKAYQTILLERLSLLVRMESEQLLSLLRGKTSQAAEPPSYRPSGQRATQPTKLLSPWQKAIALLIQNPESFKVIKPHIHLEKLPAKGVALLNTLLPLLDKEIKSAQLLEALRDTPYFSLLNQLAMTELLVPVAGLEAEFKDILVKLEHNYLKDQIQSLLQKAQAKQISDEERKMLQSLIQQSQLQKKVDKA